MGPLFLYIFSLAVALVAAEDSGNADVSVKLAECEANCAEFAQRGLCGGAAGELVCSQSCAGANSNVPNRAAKGCAPGAPSISNNLVGGECLEHVFGVGSKVARSTGFALRPPAAVGKLENSFGFRQNSFSYDVGFGTLGWVYVPSSCQPGAAPRSCGGAEPWDWNSTIARYAESNALLAIGTPGTVLGPRNIYYWKICLLSVIC
jgi:hypothetical protein